MFLQRGGFRRKKKKEMTGKQKKITAARRGRVLHGEKNSRKGVNKKGGWSALLLLGYKIGGGLWESCLLGGPLLGGWGVWGALGGLLSDFPSFQVRCETPFERRAIANGVKRLLKEALKVNQGARVGERPITYQINRLGGLFDFVKHLPTMSP